jgi:hypothetical protein
MKTILGTACLILTILRTHTQNITLISSSGTVSMAVDGTRSQQFYQYRKEMDCGMPELYIFPDSTHTNYRIQADGCQITAVEALRSPV